MAAAAAAKPAAKPAAVKVMFKAVGGAPIMKKNGFNVNPKETFGKVRRPLLSAATQKAGWVSTSALCGAAGGEFPAKDVEVG